MAPATVLPFLCFVGARAYALAATDKLAQLREELPVLEEQCARVEAGISQHKGVLQLMRQARRYDRANGGTQMVTTDLAGGAVATGTAAAVASVGSAATVGQMSGGGGGDVALEREVARLGRDVRGMQEQLMAIHSLLTSNRVRAPKVVHAIIAVATPKAKQGAFDI